MADQAASMLDSLRKPEYTGENRCVPCTIVNLVIAIAGSVLVAVVAIELAVLVFALGVLAIYLRGYLVPGTPALTERYLPDRVLGRLHPRADDVRDADAGTWETIEKLKRERTNAVDPEQFLLNVDAVGPCESEDDLCLTDGFAAQVDRLLERYRDLSVDRDAIAAVFETDPVEVSFEDRDYPAVRIGHLIRKWPSEGALIADVATHEALLERAERWADVPLEQRVEILETLRAFHDACPVCAGELLFSDDAVESCCGSFEVVALGCRDCGARYLEFDPTVVADTATDKGVRP